MTDGDVGDGDDELLVTLLAEWEVAYDEGRQLEPEALCGERAELAPRLAGQIRRLLRVKAFEGGPERSAESPIVLKDRYRLQHLIGDGTAGDVWLAHDEMLNRDVAVKMPKSGVGDDLLEEARQIAQLQHEHIIKVLDVGHDARGAVFVVTELMPGRTLAERMRRRDGRRVPVSRAIEWTTQVASALQAVHQCGLAHRDVKPTNILLNARDNAVLADFGIAIDVAAQEPGGSTGTPAYKSPEQLLGDPLDARSDVYSLGLVAHELLSGSLPFTNLDDTGAIEREIVSGVDMQVSKAIPARLRPIVTKALSRYPDLRYATAPEFAQHLVLAWQRSVLWRGVAVAGLAGLAGLALLGWRLNGDARRAAEQSARQTEEATAAARKALEIHDGARRKAQDYLELNRTLIERATQPPK